MTALSWRSAAAAAAVAAARSAFCLFGKRTELLDMWRMGRGAVCVCVFAYHHANAAYRSRCHVGRRPVVVRMMLMLMLLMLRHNPALGEFAGRSGQTGLAEGAMHRATLVRFVVVVAD